MAKNDFLPFATADGANVLSAEDYQTLPARSNGFSAGVARSQELNTVWRQASVIAHVVAQFIADTNNRDVADDGDLQTLQDGLRQALSQHINHRVKPASLTIAGIAQLSSATDSDSETMAATPKAVKAAMDLAASSAVKSVNGKKGEVQLTAGDVGALAQTGGTVNGPLTVEGNVKFTGTDYLDKSGVITDKKNTVRETNGLRIRGIEGQRADLRYWEKIGQGASLKLNVISGKSNGEFDFRQNGEFRANGGATFGGNIHVSWGGRTATFHENGDVAGPLWGGALSGYLHNTFIKKIRLGPEQHIGFKGQVEYHGPKVVTGFNNYHPDYTAAEKIYWRPIQFLIGNDWIDAGFE